MADIIRLEDRKYTLRRSSDGIIRKIVDGEIVECVNLDAMTPSQLAAYFAAAENETAKA